MSTRKPGSPTSRKMRKNAKRLGAKPPKKSKSPPTRRVRFNVLGEPVRDALIRAGLKLYAEHAIDAVAVDDIVRVARVAKGSFYTHFADKDELLNAVVRGILMQIESEVTNANRGIVDPARRAARAICVYFRFVADDPVHGGVLMRNGHSGETYPILTVSKGAEDDIRAGVASSRFTVPTVEAGAFFVVGVAYAGLIRISGSRNRKTNVIVAQQLCQLMLRGLGLASGESASIAAQAAEQILRSARPI